MIRTPVAIITGYLGSGKTTLLRRILDQTNKRIAILMNEFGLVGIDGKILKGKNVDMIELSGGCVCCSLTGEFEAAINEIVAKTDPEMIIVETTGVAEPDAIIVDIQDNLPKVRLDSVITVVDADAMIKYPSLGHTGIVQIDMADIILMNKADLVSEEQLNEVEEKIRQINETAHVFRTTKCNVDTSFLFGFQRRRFLKKKEEHTPEEDFFSFSTEKNLDREKFEKVISKLPKEIFRAKGFVKFLDKSYLFNYVSGRYDFEEFDSEKTEIVFIGKRIADLEGTIFKKLKGCEVNI